MSNTLPSHLTNPLLYSILPCSQVCNVPYSKRAAALSPSTHLQWAVIWQVRAVQGILHDVLPKACPEAVWSQLPRHLLQSKCSSICTPHLYYSSSLSFSSFLLFVVINYTFLFQLRCRSNMME